MYLLRMVAHGESVLYYYTSVEQQHLFYTSKQPAVVCMLLRFGLTKSLSRSFSSLAVPSYYTD